MAATETESSERRRTPLWAVGAAALLQVIGFTKRAAASSSQNAVAPARRSAGLGLGGGGDREGSRGRSAESPADIPTRGWKDIVLRIYQGISEDRILAIAGGVTFFVLLALFPGLAGLIALYGLYADAGTIAQHMDTLAGVMPEGGIQIIRDQVERLTAQPAHRLGLATFIGLAVSLWSANGGMKALFDALNVVYHENEKRSFIRLNTVSLSFTLGATVFILVALATMTILPATLKNWGLSQVTELFVRIGRWPILLLVVSFAVALVYRYGPSREKPQWKWITPGSAFAAIAWLCGSLLFSWYTENFGKYNET